MLPSYLAKFCVNRLNPLCHIFQLEGRLTDKICVVSHSEIYLWRFWLSWSMILNSFSYGRGPQYQYLTLVHLGIICIPDRFNDFALFVSFFFLHYTYNLHVYWRRNVYMIFYIGFAIFVFFGDIVFFYIGVARAS